MKPKQELILRSQIAEDSVIYSCDQGRLIFNIGPATLHLNGVEQTFDGRGILLAENATDSNLFTTCCKREEIHKNYEHKLLDILNTSEPYELKGNSLFCGDKFTDGNMCHAVLDHLCRAWLSKKTSLNIKNYIFYDTIWPWARQLIESLLPSKSIFYISPLQPVKCEKVYFFANSWSGGTSNTQFHHSGMIGIPLKHPACNANKKFLRILRRQARQLIIPTDKLPGAEKIFISRKSKARKFSNQHDVESLFEKHGFKKLYLEDLTTSQQLASMAKAKVVAGLHGAGLTNLIACRPSTSVLELTVGNSTWSYAKLAQALDLHYQMENIRPTGETTAAACLHTTKKAINNLTSNHQNS